MGNLKTLVSLILTLDSTSLHLASVSPELQRWAEKKTRHTKIIYLSAVFVEDTTAGAEVGDSEELQGQEIAEEEKLEKKEKSPRQWTRTICLRVTEGTETTNDLFFFKHNIIFFDCAIKPGFSLADIRKNPDPDFKEIGFFWRENPPKKWIWSEFTPSPKQKTKPKEQLQSYGIIIVLC